MINNKNQIDVQFLSSLCSHHLPCPLLNHKGILISKTKTPKILFHHVYFFFINIGLYSFHDLVYKLGSKRRNSLYFPQLYWSKSSPIDNVISLTSTKFIM
jgi:hypothetical protein